MKIKKLLIYLLAGSILHPMVSIQGCPGSFSKFLIVPYKPQDKDILLSMFTDEPEKSAVTRLIFEADFSVARDSGIIFLEDRLHILTVYWWGTPPMSGPEAHPIGFIAFKGMCEKQDELQGYIEVHIRDFYCKHTYFQTCIGRCVDRICSYLKSNKITTIKANIPNLYLQDLFSAAGFIKQEGSFFEKYYE